MELEDELVALEAAGVNVQAVVPLITTNPVIMALTIAAVGTTFCVAKSWHRHRRAG